MVLKTQERQELFYPYVEIMRDCREGNDLSQAKLAEAVGLSTKYITLLESGRRTPSLEALLALMAEAGVKKETAEDLVHEILSSFKWRG